VQHHEQELITAPRAAILQHSEAQDCTLYRPNERDPDAEETDLGDAKVLFIGPFQAPEEWDEETRAAFFDELDPSLFVTARIECEALPSARDFFVPRIGDYLATTSAEGQVVMFFVEECYAHAHSNSYLLIRDDQPLD